ncbi:MAG: indolepyruvate ferredoxin oxidoreductase subunit alpha [bacterium]
MPVLTEPKYQKAAELRGKRRPKQLAVINQGGCTGCMVCVDFCPVDCIEVVPGPDPDNPTVHKLVEVDLPRCIGCTLCAQYCPWETIEMFSFAEAYKIAPDWTLKAVVEKQWQREPVKEEQPVRPRRREQERKAAED